MTRLYVPETVGVDVMGEVVYVAPLPDGPITVLDGIAAFIWEQALQTEQEDVAARVAAATGRAAEEIEEEVLRFLEDLRSRGLVTQRPSDVPCH